MMPPEPPAEKKGIPALGWVGIGCGSLVIIAVVIISLLIGWCKRAVGDLADFGKHPEKAAAELMVRMNPDLQKISENDSTGEMTVRTKDGKNITLSYKELSEGKFTFKDSEGNSAQFGRTNLDDVPGWVPRVPGMKAVQTSMRNQKGGKVSGLYSVTSSESTEVLEAFFKGEAEKLKFTSSSFSNYNVNGVENRNLTFSGGGHHLDIVFTAKPGEETQVNVGYEEKE